MPANPSAMTPGHPKPIAEVMLDAAFAAALRSLPTEITQKVYQQLILLSQDDTHLSLTLMRTCKKLANEISPNLYRQVTLTMDNAALFEAGRVVPVDERRAGG
ncbi:hypothetical protein IAR50_003789 [Cryptococcus sp. DSM 104548]